MWISVYMPITVSGNMDVTATGQSPAISPSSSHDLLSSQEYPDKKGDIGQLIFPVPSK